MVCEGVMSRAVFSSLLIMRFLEQRRAAAAQHDVELVAERPFGLRRLQIELRDEALARRLVRDRVEDRIEGKKRVSREIHLGDETRQERVAEQREMDMGRTPGVVMVT